MYTPVNPSFTVLKWGLRGLKLYRPVFVMILKQPHNEMSYKGVPMYFLSQEKLPDLDLSKSIPKESENLS